MPVPSNRLISFLSLLVLGCMAALSIYLTMPPKALPADAPVNEFSAIRAMKYVRNIAREPHAVGTPGHARVQEYLLQEMNALGLAPQVQEATVLQETKQACYAGNVYNIVGKLNGKERGKAVLLVAHYDSQPHTPGAGDDAAGVAALLETARALQQEELLQNDIIFLLTDGEEFGLLGARGFMQHPWAKDIGVVINVEARGNSGASATFEMSSENGWVVQEFAKAAPYPLAGSIMYEVYKRMPNSTDFTIFSQAGMSGVNSAFVEGFVNYHSLTDTPENLNYNSLQHHGSNMLALARHFGSISLEDTKAPDKVFFNPIGKWLVQYPVGLNPLWVGVATLLLVVVWSVGTKRKAFTGKQIVAGALLYLVVIAAVAGPFIPLNTFVTGTMPYHTPSGTYNIYLFFIAYVLLALGLFLLLYSFILLWLQPLAGAMGACLVWFILLSVTVAFVPSAAYLFLFPLLFCLAGLLIILKKRKHTQVNTWQYILVFLVTSLPALFMLMPIVHTLLVVFDLIMPVAMVASLLLLLGLLLPVLLSVERALRYRHIPVLPLLLLLAGALLTFVAVQKEKPSAKQPFKTHVSYFLNKDTNQALWASANRHHDKWTGAFFTEDSDKRALTGFYPHASLVYHVHEARTLPLPAPVAALELDSVADNKRFLRLHMKSLRQAQHLEMLLLPANTGAISEIKLNGQRCSIEPIDTEEGPLYFIRLYGLPLTKDAMLELTMDAGNTVGIYLYDYSIGLPTQLLATPMPSDVVPMQGNTSNVTVVRRRYNF